MARRRLIGQSKQRRGLGVLRRNVTDVAEMKRAPQGITATAGTGSIIVKVGKRHYRLTAVRLD